jgi:hypothetical protein
MQTVFVNTPSVFSCIIKASQLFIVGKSLVANVNDVRTANEFFIAMKATSVTGEQWKISSETVLALKSELALKTLSLCANHIRLAKRSMQGGPEFSEKQ